MKLTGRLLVIIFLIAVVLTILVIFISSWDQISSIIRLILLGAVFAYILTPVSELLEKYVSRPVAVLILIAAMIMLLTLVFFLLLPKFFSEVSAAAERLPNLIESFGKIGTKIQDTLERAGLPSGLRTAFMDYSKKLEDVVTKFISTGADKLVKILASLPELVLVPVLGFYFLKDREYFSKMLISLMPCSKRNDLLRIFKEINIILHQFIRGQILVSLAVAVLSAAGYWIVGLPYSLILGLFMGAMEIIPYFGPWLGAIPAILIALINGPAKLLWMAVVLILIQQLENSIITPKILGNEVRLHPVYVILSIWAGGMFYGLLGMLFAVPFILVLRILFKHLIISVATDNLLR